MRKAIVVSMFTVILMLAGGCYPVNETERGPAATPAVDVGTVVSEPTATEETADTDTGAPIEAAREVLANEQGIEPGDLELVESEAADWADACLQAAEPGEMCAAVITPGYRLVFDTPAGEIEVRTDVEGEQVRVMDAAGAQTGDDLPAAVAAAIALAAEERGFDPGEIEVVGYEQVEWRDSCLGASRPGEMCLQVITPGYRVSLETPEGRLDVHTDRGGQLARVVTPAESPVRGRDVIVWERSGGIAGICQRLAIFTNGQFLLEDCRRNVVVDRGALAEADWAAIEALLGDFGAFTWEDVPPANSADMFSDRYTLKGAGSGTPDEAQQEAINEQLAQLAGRLAERQ